MAAVMRHRARKQRTTDEETPSRSELTTGSSLNKGRASEHKSGRARVPASPIPTVQRGGKRGCRLGGVGGPSLTIRAMRHARTLQSAENRQVASKAECLLRCDGPPPPLYDTCGCWRMGKHLARHGFERIDCHDTHSLVCPGGRGTLLAVWFPPQTLARASTGSETRFQSLDRTSPARLSSDESIQGLITIEPCLRIWVAASPGARLHGIRVTSQAWIRW